MMDITRIDKAVLEGTLGQNTVIGDTIRSCKSTGGRLHLLGLLSDGGVHSSIEHLFALIDLAHREGVPVVVHAFLDGRDVQPKTAPGYTERLLRHLDGKGIIGTIAGRYWGMDRDHRWERVERAYRAIVSGDAPRHEALAGVLASFQAGKTDEFVEPFVVGDYRGVEPAGDAALHTNFRPDRARELTRALALSTFDGFPRAATPPFLRYACMTTYDSAYSLPVAFPKETFPDVFPEVLARAGRSQLRCAETEKYAHVTYFFNGGREEPFPLEDRTMIPSPRDVATYDQKPEMSARAIADAVVRACESKKYDFILVNFANPDMVGHTGNLAAAIVAVDSVDAALGRVTDAVEAAGGALVITADHGNCELMRDPKTGEPHTAHTTNRVPLLLVSEAARGAHLATGGRICDVAPTLLTLLQLPQPEAMTGRSLLGQT
jgi:2,3-bisphosphoglycerate-independent phosphoglycerate mutase